LQETFSAHDQVASIEIHEGLEKVVKLSEYLNFPFKLDEVADFFLPRMNLTSGELRSLLSAPEFADIPFRIEDGCLLASNAQTLSARLEREQTSAAKLDSAARFAKVLTRLVPFIQTVAVTGSVAYGSAERWDDIDLFIVTKRNRLWLSALMTLILVRMTKLLGLRPPHLSPFCLSYVHDEQGFAAESQRNRTNPLFARELLKAKPVAGSAQYRRILKKNDWVGGFYSEPYAAMLRGLNNKAPSRENEPDKGSGWSSFPLEWAEGVVFTFLGRYLRLRAYLTNLKLKSKRQDFRVFAPKISPASCVYTSNFYDWLGSLWGQ